MDTKQTSAQHSPIFTSHTNLSLDPEHINLEMYKKNVELIEQNKTLSLLRKIDEIILSSVTNVQEIAQHVTKLLVSEPSFKLASIIIIGPGQKNLIRLSLSESSSVTESKHHDLEKSSFIFYYPMSDERNIIVQAVKERRMQVTNNFYDVSFHQVSEKQAHEVQESAGIKSFLIYPLVVRDQVIGAICLGLGEYENELSLYQKDLIERLVSVVGIAIDNAVLYTQVKYTNEKLEVIDKLKTEFVSLASHELRTPMTAIKSYLWMALSGRGGTLNEKQKFYLDRAYNSTDRLIKLVNDMLNISRIESGRLSLDLQKIDLQLLVKEVLEEIMPRAQELSIILSVQQVPNLPMVIADPLKIKEVVINLIGNSLKFTPKRGKINISYAFNNDYVATYITDTGAGISADDMPKLFHKFGFVQGSYTVNQSASQGTGLGLYISKSIVEMHKGKIEVKSGGVGKGSTFSFSLPSYSEQKLEKLRQTYKVENKNAVDLIHTEI